MAARAYSRGIRSDMTARGSEGLAAAASTTCQSASLSSSSMIGGGSAAGGAGRQIAVESRALWIVHERRLFTVADQATLCGWQPLAGEQRRQYGRWRRLVGRHRATDLGMRMHRKSGGRLRCRPQRELRDDLYVRVGGQHLHHVERQAGTGGELLPALDDWIFCEVARPLRVSRTLIKQGERDLRLRRGIDVCGGQQTCIRKRHSAFLDTRGQSHRLRAAEVGPTSQVRSNLGVRDRDQPVDQLGRQAYVDGKPAQNMVHRGILPGTSPNGSWILTPRCYRWRGGPDLRSEVPIWSFSLRMDGYDIGWCLGGRALAQLVAWRVRTVLASAS